MGYFGKSITASDPYEDFTYSLLKFLGWKYNDSDDYDSDDYKPHIERVGKETFEERLNELISWFNENHGFNQEAIFLAYHFLIRGVDISNERIDLFIACFKEDEWAKQDVERRIYMNLAVEALEKYKTDKTPVDIDFYYDFERYYLKDDMNSDKLTPVSDIIIFFEEQAGIEIIQSVRSMYDLYFIVSEEDFKKINGLPIMGIKFLTQTT